MNPFHHSLDDNFRGRRVRAVSNDGAAYEGWVERLHHRDRHVVLRDATDLETGDDVGSVMLAHADIIEEIESDSQIELVTVDDIEPSPFHAAEFNIAANRQYIADVRETGFVGSFPLVREVAGRLQVVEGHKRLWVCQQASVDEHPVEIVALDDWEATRRFVVDHLPAAHHVNDDGSTQDGYYGPDAIATVVDVLVDRWGERVLELDRVARNVDRLALEINRGESPATELDGSAGEADEFSCDVDGCDYSGSSKRALAIHESKAHVEDVDESETDNESRDKPQVSVEDEVVDVLREHGELAATDVMDYTEKGDYTYNLLRQLQDDGRVVSRKDPEDKRRTLYRLADEDEDSPTSEGDTALAAEASDADFKESDADDSPAEPGEVADNTPEDDIETETEPEPTFPRDCHCGATLHDSFELAVHRTEEHGVPQASLGHLEQGEFETIVAEAETVEEVLHELDWSTERALRAFGVYGLDDVVGAGDRSLSDITDFEFDGVTGNESTAADAEQHQGETESRAQTAESAQKTASAVGDESDIGFTDWDADTATGIECQNCGAQVTKQYAKVNTPEGESAPRICPNCPNLVREADGTIRESRSGGKQAGGSS